MILTGQTIDCAEEGVIHGGTSLDQSPSQRPDTNVTLERRLGISMIF